MSDIELVEKIKMLPAEKKKRLESIINDILSSEDSFTSSGIRKPGFAKGMINILPGFDDPIEGMEEYTQ